MRRAARHLAPANWSTLARRAAADWLSSSRSRNSPPVPTRWRLWDAICCIKGLRAPGLVQPALTSARVRSWVHPTRRCTFSPVQSARALPPCAVLKSAHGVGFTPTGEHRLGTAHTQGRLRGTSRYCGSLEADWSFALRMRALVLRRAQLKCGILAAANLRAVLREAYFHICRGLCRLWAEPQ